MRKAVFAPIFGEQSVADWTTVPHIKAWGIWDDAERQFEVIHMVNQGAATVYIPTTLFDSEIEHMRDIEDFEVGELPDEVCQRLAVRALTSVRED